MTNQLIAGLSVLHIRSRLCVYDPRHPDYADQVEQFAAIEESVPRAAASKCGCDNCFYGREELASALLFAGGAA